MGGDREALTGQSVSESLSSWGSQGSGLTRGWSTCLLCAFTLSQVAHLCLVVPFTYPGRRVSFLGLQLSGSARRVSFCLFALRCNGAEICSGVRPYPTLQVIGRWGVERGRASCSPSGAGWEHLPHSSSGSQPTSPSSSLLSLDLFTQSLGTQLLHCPLTV